MICQQCKLKPATLHFTKIINGEKSEIRVCEKCAKESGEMFSLSGGGFSINSLLAGLLNMESPITKSPSNAFSETKVPQCPKCKMTYHQFAKFGRFGCAQCYRIFQSALTPFLKRLHGGNDTHTGKIPKRIGSNIHLKKELEDMKLNLKEYIAAEEFEKAAELRDRIRSLEKKLHNERGGEA